MFTIILLGETAPAGVHALGHGSEGHAKTVLIAMLGAGLGFLFRVGYFHRAKGMPDRASIVLPKGA